MKGYRQIVLALEFTPSAHRVLDAALSVAAEGASLHLLHVVEWTPSVVEGTLVTYSNPKEVRELHRNSLRKMEEYARACVGVRVSVDVVEGNPAQAILEEAAKEGADLIVLGYRGRHGLPGIPPGSLVDRVMRHAVCPLLVVPG